VNDPFMNNYFHSMPFQVLYRGSVR